MTQLSAETIAAAALRIVDADGLGALSMRRLGRDLGVDAKAVYYYFGNKDQLIDAVLQRAFAELPGGAQPTTGWPDEIRQLARITAQLVSDHPNLLPVLLRYDGSVPVVFTLVERVARALEPSGLPGRAIVQIVDLLWSLLPSLALPDDEQSNQALHVQLTGLPQAEYPVTWRLLRGLQPAELASDLDFQIDLIIGGIAALIERFHAAQ